MATRGSSEPPICPVEAPAPWRVESNALRALEPDELPPDDPRWGWFTEDLLHLVHPSDLRVDVGWLPDGAPSGRFHLAVVRDRDWRHPVHRSEHRSLAGLLAELREQLAVPVGQERSEAELEALVRGAEDPRDAVSHVLALRERRALGALLSLLADPRERVRYAVVDALTVLGDPSAGEALFARFLLPEPDLETRRRLIDALGAAGHLPAAPVLARWLGNPDADQRIRAARALVALGATEAIDAVQEAYATERSHRVRPHLQEALQKLARARR